MTTDIERLEALLMENLAVARDLYSSGGAGVLDLDAFYPEWFRDWFVQWADGSRQPLSSHSPDALRMLEWASVALPFSLEALKVGQESAQFAVKGAPFSLRSTDPFHPSIGPVFLLVTERCVWVEMADDRGTTFSMLCTSGEILLMVCASRQVEGETEYDGFSMYLPLTQAPASLSEKVLEQAGIPGGAQVLLTNPKVCQLLPPTRWLRDSSLPPAPPETPRPITTTVLSRPATGRN